MRNLFAVVICSKEMFKVYWPHNSSEDATVKLVEIIIKFLKDLYSSFQEEFSQVDEITEIVCPSKLEVKDYWVFLLTAMKRYALVEAFDGENFDVKKEKSILERELRSQKLFNKKTPTLQPRIESTKIKKNQKSKPTSSKKRSHSPEVSVLTKKKGKLVSPNTFLKNFHNNDSVTCWLNSSIQVS